MRVGRRLKWPDDFFYVQGLFRYQYNNVIEGRGFMQKEKQSVYFGTTITERI
jgi:outer membrane protein insertion porin family